MFMLEKEITKYVQFSVSITLTILSSLVFTENLYLVANAPGTTSTVVDLAIFKNEATSGEQETNGYSAVESAEDTEVGNTCIDDETGGYATVAFNPATAVVANGAHYKVPRSPPPAIEGTAVTNESHYQVPRSPPPAIESTAVTNESHYQVPRSPPPTIESAAVANGNHFPPPTSESGYDRLLPKTKTESQYDRLRPKTVSASTEGNDSSVKTQQSDNIPKTQLNNGKEVDDHHYTAGGDLYAAPTLTKPRPLPRKKTPREKEESDEQPNVGFFVSSFMHNSVLYCDFRLKHQLALTKMELILRGCTTWLEMTFTLYQENYQQHVKEGINPITQISLNECVVELLYSVLH